jgi:hypothetical protein
MRKLAVAIAIVGTLAVSTSPADAQYHNRGHGGGGHHHHRGGGGGWVAPLLGGLVLGGAIYGLSQPSYAAPPTYYAPPPAYRTECQIVPVYDRNGYFRGERRECYQVPNY